MHSLSDRAALVTSCHHLPPLLPTCRSCLVDSHGSSTWTIDHCAVSFLCQSHRRDWASHSPRLCLSSSLYAYAYFQQPRSLHRHCASSTHPAPRALADRDKTNQSIQQPCSHDCEPDGDCLNRSITPRPSHPSHGSEPQLQPWPPTAPSTHALPDSAQMHSLHPGTAAVASASSTPSGSKFRQSKAHQYRKRVVRFCASFKRRAIDMDRDDFHCPLCNQSRSTAYARCDHVISLKTLWLAFEQVQQTDPHCDWPAYHHAHAILRVVCKDCQMSATAAK